MESTQPTQQSKLYKVLTIVISVFVAMGMAFNVFLFAIIASQTFMTTAVNAQVALPNSNEKTQEKPEQPTQQQTTETTQQEPTAVKTPSETQTKTATELTVQEFKQYRDELLEVLDREDPKVAMERLGAMMEENPLIVQSCHALVHEIGHEAIEKYGTVTAAMQYQNDLCGSGYLHGLIEEKFSETDDIQKEMTTICEPENDQSCFHGVGHGLMIVTENNVPKSLEYCDMYTTRVAQVGCAEGVFMENFNTDTSVHTSAFLHPEDPFFPCPEQKSLYQAVCYFYAPNYYLNLHKNAFTEALQWCATTPGGYENACAKGVGSRAMKKNIENIPLVEAVCESLPDLTPACIDGMVSYYIVNFASVEKGRELCSIVLEDHQEACLAAVELRKNWY